MRKHNRRFSRRINSTSSRRMNSTSSTSSNSRLSNSRPSNSRLSNSSLSNSSLSKLVRSLQSDEGIYGLSRNDEIGELARAMDSMREEIAMSEFNLHSMMMEREHQEYLMRTIDNVSFALLATAIEDEEGFENALQEGLTEVAQCADVDGIYVYRNIIQDAGSQFDLQVEWANNPSEAPPPREVTRYFYKDIPGWERRFSTGMPFNAARSDLSQNERKVLGLGTQAVLILPVHLHELFWGLVFYEDYKRERTFTTDQVSLLQSASLMIVSAVRRKKQATRVNEANARVKLMLDAIPIGCFLWNSNLEVIDCNPSTLALFKAGSKEELIARFKKTRPVYQPGGQLSNEMAELYLVTAFREGACDYEFMYCALDGTLFPVEVNLRRVQFGGDYVIAEYIRDIREQQHLLHELERRRLQLEKALSEAQAASQAKSDFLSNMSHEIRTPLNAITGMTAIGVSANDLHKKDDSFKKIESASSHLLGVINDILDMSKIEAGKLEIYEEAFNLEKTISKVLNIIMFKVEEKNQTFHTNIESGVPAMIVGDDQRLTQVLTNILGNAVKFTPKGKEIRLEIQLLERRGDLCRLKFSIIAQGIGISQEQQDRLFTSFTQAEASTTRKFGGTGLGLAISKHIVEMMGGSIWIESELGHGATFSFTLEAKIWEEEQIEDYQVEDMEDITFPGKVLLLAEDMEINQEIVVAILEPAEITVECAGNGAVAVKMFEANPSRYDLIFMDVQMPVMDGFEAARKIRALDVPEAASIPIVAMTANVFREDVERCLDAGMDAHLGKPLDLDAVMKTLWRYLR